LAAFHIWKICHRSVLCAKSVQHRFKKPLHSIRDAGDNLIREGFEFGRLPAGFASGRATVCPIDCVLGPQRLSISWFAAGGQKTRKRSGKGRFRPGRLHGSDALSQWLTRARPPHQIHLLTRSDVSGFAPAWFACDDGHDPSGQMCADMGFWPSSSQKMSRPYRSEDSYSLFRWRAPRDPKGEQALAENLMRLRPPALEMDTHIKTSSLCPRAPSNKENGSPQLLKGGQKCI
jgi:hypothetical protein